MKAKEKIEKPYTVCGEYDTGQTFVFHVIAESDDDAVVAAMTKLADPDDHEIVIGNVLFLFPGHHYCHLCP